MSGGERKQDTARKQHDPEAVKAQRDKAAAKRRKTQVRRNLERAEQVRDRMFEPVEGWVWCSLRGADDAPHRGIDECTGNHRKLWVERMGGGNV